MPRQSPQIAKIIEFVLRNSRGRMSAVWVVLLVVAVGGYLFAEPALEAHLGVDLPGVSTPSSSPTVDSDRPHSAEPPSDPPLRDVPATTTPDDESRAEIERILRHVGNDVFVSPAGLRYTKGSTHGHRLKHLMAHTQDESNRPGSHGVFDATESAEVVLLVDEVYRQALKGQKTHEEIDHDRTVYTVNLERRVGYIGGESGKRQGHPVAKYVKLVVEADSDSDRFITAYPVRNW